MTSFVSHTSVDCSDAYELSEFWKLVLGYVDVADDPNEPGHEECMILDPETGHQLLFIEVPETKTVKNRLHLDLRPRTGTRDAEVARLVGLVRASSARRSRGRHRGWSTVVRARPAVTTTATTHAPTNMTVTPSCTARGRSVTVPSTTATPTRPASDRSIARPTASVQLASRRTPNHAATPNSSTRLNRSMPRARATRGSSTMTAWSGRGRTDAILPARFF